jgi:hypothetical protein
MVIQRSDSEMLKVFCLYFEGKYSPDYIKKLHNGLKRNCDVPFEFICYSDTTVDADQVITLPKDTPIQQHWHKLKFFDKEFTGEGDIVVLDIDQVIVNNITPMLNWPVGENELVSYHKWWSRNENSLPINGGWYKFKAGSLQCVWDKYISDPEYWQLYYYKNSVVHFKYFGEQNFVYDTCIENNIKVTTMPGEWVAKYDKDIKKNSRYNMFYSDAFDQDFMILGEELNENIKIVHFANVDNTIHSHPDEWITTHWI